MYDSLRRHSTNNHLWMQSDCLVEISKGHFLNPQFGELVGEEGGIEQVGWKKNDIQSMGSYQFSHWSPEKCIANQQATCHTFWSTKNLYRIRNCRNLLETGKWVIFLCKFKYDASNNNKKFDKQHEKELILKKMLLKIPFLTSHGLIKSVNSFSHSF